MREPVMCCLEGGVSDIVCRAAGGGVRMRDGQPGQEGQSPAGLARPAPGAGLARAASMLEACRQTAVPQAGWLCLDRPAGRTPGSQHLRG